MQQNSKVPVYINKPIKDEEADIIGLDLYAEMLNDALPLSKTIGVVADYGTGKSSFIEYFCKKHLIGKKVVKINLWEASDAKNDLMLHFHFLQQFSLGLNKPRVAKYVNKKLNSNYGLISVFANPGACACAFISIIAYILFYLSKAKHPIKGVDNPNFIDYLLNFTNIGGVLALIISIVAIIIAISKSTVIFSNGKNSGRTINKNDIIEIYKEIVAKYGNKEIVIIIEDLDRSSNADVIKFLKEFNKLYIDTLSDKENVKFIINLKSESGLGVITEPIYPKIFNYIINLHPVNIDNYSEIIDSLLNEKKEEFKNLGINIKDKDNIKETEGMDIICYGKNLSIRNVKERLNHAVQIYSSLKDRAQNASAQKAISFRRCAFVAYIKNAFPDSFNLLAKHDFISEIIIKYAKDELKSVGFIEGEIKDKIKDYDKTAPSSHDEFAKEMATAINNRTLDTSYRMYLYNYPKNAYFRTVDEQIIYDAIIYEYEVGSDFNEIIKKVYDENPEYIVNTYDERVSLKESLPRVTFDYEILSSIAFTNHKNAAIKYFKDNLDFTQEKAHSSNRFLEKLFSLRLDWDSIIPIYAEEFSNIFIEKFYVAKKEQVINLRKRLINYFSEYIDLFKKVFVDSEVEITLSEIELINNLDKCLYLSQNQDIDINAIEKILSLSLEKELNSKQYIDLNNMFLHAISYIEDKRLAECISKHIIHTGELIPELEKYVANYIDESEYFKNTYLAMVNSSKGNGATSVTVGVFVKNEIFAGLDKETAINVFKDENDLLFVTHYFSNEITLNDIKHYSNEIEENVADILTNCPKSFYNIRRGALIANVDVRELKYLFFSPQPIINEDELYLNKKFINVIDLIDHKLINESNYAYIANYFNTKCGRTSKNVTKLLAFIRNVKMPIKGKLFYALNFSKIKYRACSVTNRNSFIDSVELDFNLEDNKLEIIRFLKQINALEPTLEERLDERFEESKINSEYVNLINTVPLSEINETTMSVIRNNGYYGNYNQDVQKVLYDNGLFEKYVYAKIKTDKIFNFEYSKIEYLREAYKRILFNEKVPDIHEVMLNSEEFLVYCLETGWVSNVTDKEILFFTRIDQSAILLDYVFERNDETITEYILKLSAIDDEDVQLYLANKITDNEELLRDIILFRQMRKICSNQSYVTEYKKKRDALLRRDRKSKK